MRLKSHIKIAKVTLENIRDKMSWEINEQVYLMGSIAPDLNVLFPRHSINNTLNRWRRRVKRIDKTSSNIVKSFTLGVIIHYICDYFCYAHNIKANSIGHIMYERKLNKHIMDQKISLYVNNSNMRDHWEGIETQLKDINIINEIEECNSGEIGRVVEKEAEKLDVITNYLVDMNEEYMRRNGSIPGIKWYKDMNKVKLDIRYAGLMANLIALVLVSEHGI